MIANPIHTYLVIIPQPKKKQQHIS